MFLNTFLAMSLENIVLKAFLPGIDLDKKYGKIALPNFSFLTQGLYVMLRDLGAEVVTSYNTKDMRRPLELGQKYSPESMCIPFKYLLGETIKSLDAGAETVIMLGGQGTCRFGCYGNLMRRITDDLGYDYDVFDVANMSNLGSNATSVLLRLFELGKSNGKSVLDIYSSVKRGIDVVLMLEDLDRLYSQCRPRADQDSQRLITSIERSVTKQIFEEPELSNKKIMQIKNETISKLNGKEQHEKQYVKTDWEKRIPKIHMIGELYVVVVPESNFFMKRMLGNLGLEVDQSIYPSHWLEGVMRYTHPLSVFSRQSSHGLERQAQRDARPFLNRDINGDGYETVGQTIRAAKHGYHGVVHLQPFTCGPETIANNISLAARTLSTKDIGRFKKLYNVDLEPQVPFFSFNIDVNTAEAGIVTRAEALTDLFLSKFRRSLAK